MDLVESSIDEQRPFQGCSGLYPKAHCSVSWRGAIILASQDKGEIALLAFSNRGQIPFASSSMPMEKGWRRLIVGNPSLEFTVPGDAYQVEFQIQLKGKDGTILAQSKRVLQAFDVHPSPPPG